MRSESSLVSLACGMAAAVFIGAIVIVAPDSVRAEASQPGPSCSCPDSKAPDAGAKPQPQQKPKLADARPPLPRTAEIAAFEAIHLALSEVGDGSTYVWHGRDGVISGSVKPVASFKDASGRICRHILLSLSAGSVTRSTEGIACRLPDRSWQLEG